MLIPINRAKSEGSTRRVNPRLVLRKAGPGGIICLHDGRDIQPSPDVSEMLKAVREIVPVLKGEGFGFETVSELLLPTAA